MAATLVYGHKHRSESTQKNRERLCLPTDASAWLDSVEKAAKSRSSWIGLLHRRASDRARRRGWTFHLSHDDVADIALRTFGLCEVTGIPFSWNKQPRIAVAPFAPSLDRIDAEKTYSHNNVRMVCVCVNAALGQWGDHVFWQMVMKAKNKPTQNQ